jgi:hypothetical protein
MASAHHKNSVADLWLAVIYELEIASRSRLAIRALTDTETLVARSELLRLKLPKAGVAVARCAVCFVATY